MCKLLYLSVSRERRDVELALFLFRLEIKIIVLNYNYRSVFHRLDIFLPFLLPSTFFFGGGIFR